MMTKEQLIETIKSQDISQMPSYSNGAFTPNDINFDYYRLLRFLSDKFENEIILDIGTHFGKSCAALALNKKNKVKTYDIIMGDYIDQGTRDRATKDLGIEYLVQNAKTIDPDLYKKARMIFLDVDPHDGIQEPEIHKLIEDSGFKGILVLDDIFWTDGMKNYWNSVKQPKLDVTFIGHHESGTGVVFFNDEDKMLFNIEQE